MKTLQSDFTTPEQSEKLLAMGIPANTADFYYERHSDIKFERMNIRLNKIELADDFFEKHNLYTPHWSTGRLMEIAHICSDSTLSYKEEANEIQKFKEEHKCETLIEAVIMCIADAVSIGGMDFSKLEE